MTATPTPTPTPPPTPTPSPSYSTYRDPLGDWRAGPPFAFSQMTYSRQTGVPSKMDASIEFGMVDAGFSGSPSITAHFSDFTKGYFTSYSAADVIFQREGVIVLNKRNADLSFTSIGYDIREFDDYKYQYILPAVVTHTYPSGSGVPSEDIELMYSFIVGSRTVDSDLPTPITETLYVTRMTLHHRPSFDTIPGQMVGDLTLSKTGALSGKFILTSEHPSGDIRTFVSLITGSMDQQTHRISGDITGGNGAFVGKFQGYLYGPKGKELAFLVYLKNADGSVATSGTIIGYQWRFQPGS
jgi:hypothetical protein